MGVFFILGLFKGFLWQVSRFGILIAAYTAAAQFGQPLADVLVDMTHSGAEPVSDEKAQTSFYISCVIIFLGVVVVLSMIAVLLHKLMKKAGLGFFDRLGGGVVGVGAGAVLVVLGMMLLHMFFPQSRVAEAASESHSLHFTRRAIDLLEDVVPQEVRKLFPNDGEAPESDPAQDPNSIVLPSTNEDRKESPPVDERIRK